MNNTLKNVWHRIEKYDLDAVDATFPFSARLARENDWSIAYAKNVIEEYKKFMFLIKVAGHPCTPSDAVDQVWHLHLVYTRDYWQVWCKEILEQEVHHGPTKGGNKERAKFHDWYEQTKATYQRLFNQIPPPQIWPSSTIRFSEIDFRRVNTHKNFVLSKVKVITGIIAFFAFNCLTFSSSDSVFPLSSSAFMTIFFCIFIPFIVLLFIYSYKNGHTKKSNRGAGSNGGTHSGSDWGSWGDGDSGCGSGCSGCGGCGGCG